ncbi:hypothetical protein C8J43_101203 [Sphingomonas sp. PP-CE-1G-424]|nr:hypothetical protein C8J43_101203 [Sphingomonas sp. PP-CE-1G-424]
MPGCGCTRRSCGSGWWQRWGGGHADVEYGGSLDRYGGRGRRDGIDLRCGPSRRRNATDATVRRDRFVIGLLSHAVRGRACHRRHRMRSRRRFAMTRRGRCGGKRECRKQKHQEKPHQHMIRVRTHRRAINPVARWRVRSGRDRLATVSGKRDSVGIMIVSSECRTRLLACAGLHACIHPKYPLIGRIRGPAGLRGLERGTAYAAGVMA